MTILTCTRSLRLTETSVSRDALVKISQYLETHCWGKKRSGSSTGESRCYTVSVTCGFVDVLLVRIEKGVDRGDDVPCL
jgi:hypothetical protein